MEGYIIYALLALWIIFFGFVLGWLDYKDHKDKERFKK
jgi:hypothetical protein